MYLGMATSLITEMALNSVVVGDLATSAMVALNASGYEMVREGPVDYVSKWSLTRELAIGSMITIIVSLALQIYLVFKYRYGAAEAMWHGKWYTTRVSQAAFDMSLRSSEMCAGLKVDMDKVIADCTRISDCNVTSDANNIRWGAFAGVSLTTRHKDLICGAGRGVTTYSSDEREQYENGVATAIMMQHNQGVTCHPWYRGLTNFIKRIRLPRIRHQRPVAHSMFTIKSWGRTLRAGHITPTSIYSIIAA